MLASIILRLTFPTRTRSIGCLKQCETVRSKLGRAIFLFQMDPKDPNRISRGAGQYADMCSGCHLAPGMKRTEMSEGLYPRVPELRRKTTLTPEEQFWVVKHGMKKTGMPAWGVTHDDDLLWDVVAFVRKLPELTPEQYKTLVKNAPKHEELMQKMEMGGEQQHNAGHE